MAIADMTDFIYTLAETKYGVAPKTRRSVKRQYAKAVRYASKREALVIVEIEAEADAHEAAEAAEAAWQYRCDVDEAYADHAWQKACETIYFSQADDVEDMIENMKEASGFYGVW